VSTPHLAPLPTTTSTGEPGDETSALERAIRFGDLLAAAGAMDDGAATDLEHTTFQCESGEVFGNLTGLSLAALVDSEAGVALMLPLLITVTPAAAELASMPVAVAL